MSIYAGLLFSAVAFAVGAALPVITLVGSSTAYMMSVAGLILTAIFVAMAVLAIAEPTGEGYWYCHHALALLFTFL